MRRITEQHGEEAGFFFTNKYIFLSWCLRLGNYPFKILSWFWGTRGPLLMFWFSGYYCYCCCCLKTDTTSEKLEFLLNITA